VGDAAVAPDGGKLEVYLGSGPFVSLHGLHELRGKMLFLSAI